MGVVYRAEQLGVGRIVALKFIKPELLDDLADDQRSEIIGRFQAEARAAARLDHDHIVTVYEVGEIGGRHFYSMRYVEGQSLGDALAGGPLANHKAAAYLEAVAHAVGYAHARGILHRDIKPRNILVDAADRPFVADFGLAKSLEDKPGRTRTGDWVGSPPYMSPEQFRSPSLIGPASDVYALGATLYEMLTR